MKIEIPFVKQENHSDCGIISLKMVLDYYGENVSIKKLEEFTIKKENKGLYSIQIAIAAAKLGYNADFYSKSINFNEEHLKKDFYKKYSDENPTEQSLKFINEAKSLGVNIEEKRLSLQEIIELISTDSIPIILLDFNIVMAKEGYHGHFVPIVGYDDENIFVHDPGLNNPKAFLKINKKTFDNSRKSDGTDEDLVVIYRK
jgi:uncharacterized protein YvpB